MNECSEDTLVQQTTAEYLENQLGYEVVCFYIFLPLCSSPQGM